MVIFRGDHGKAWVWSRLDQLIMNCVKLVTYQGRVNGHESHTITPSRGLREEDLLSPYLFFLWVEGLSSLLKYDESSGNLIGVKVCRDALAVSHLLFQMIRLF
jgi:hypothetical protein